MAQSTITNCVIGLEDVHSLKNQVKKLESINRILKSRPMCMTLTQRNTLLKEQRKAAHENLKRQNENLKNLLNMR